MTPSARTIMRAGVAAGLLAGLAACASTPQTIAPRWASVPGPWAMAGAYPPLAAMLGLEGWAHVSCIAMLDQRLGDCVVVDQSPEGLGFGRAAISLTPEFRLASAETDGVAEKSSVQFYVRFALPSQPHPGRWAGPEPELADIEAARALTAWVTEIEFERRERNLGVDEDRVEPISQAMSALEAQYAPRAADLEALALARFLTRPQIDALVEGRPPPGSPAEPDIAAAAYDQFNALEQEYRTQVKAWYCGRYKCTARPTPGPPRPSANLPRE